jgi:hypothetical protein
MKNAGKGRAVAVRKGVVGAELSRYGPTTTRVVAQVIENNQSRIGAASGGRIC